MVISIIRHYEDSCNSNIITCTDVDYGIAEILGEVYLKHAQLLYKILANKLDPNLGKNMEMLLKALPIIPFRRKEAGAIGAKLGISERTISSYLKLLLENKYLTQDKPQGLYQRATEL
jgi:hypothetical protein